MPDRVLSLVLLILLYVATWAQCEFDMTMMVVNGGLERSERQWAELLAEAGFEVVQFWQKYPDSEGIIEAIISPL